VERYIPTTPIHGPPHTRTTKNVRLICVAAIAFTYFEALLRVGDKNRFLEEETRLRSLRNLLNTIGFQEHLYEDFADECYDLLRRTGAAVPAVDDTAGAELLASFNDVSISMAIITYFKVCSIDTSFIHHFPKRTTADHYTSS
jgi:ubiquitin thioesterase protein OTUB1